MKCAVLGGRSGPQVAKDSENSLVRWMGQVRSAVEHRDAALITSPKTPQR